MTTSDFSNKNIWLAFLLVLIAWSGVFISAAYITYNDVYSDATERQRSITSIKANTLTSRLQKYEVIIDILSVKLLNNDTYRNKESSLTLIDSVVNIDESLHSIGIFDVNGDTFLATSNVRLDKRYNLSELPHTKDTFKETLLSESAVLGRTYYSDLQNGFVMPLRKSIRNQKGEVVFVLAIAIDLMKGLDFLVSGPYQDSLLNAYIFRENDNFFQLAPFGRFDLPESYLTAVPSSLSEEGKRDLSDKLGIDINDIMEKELVVVNETTFSEGAALISSVFLKQHQLWLTTATGLDVVYDLFIKEASVLMAVFIISTLLFFQLFRTISEKEKKKQTELRYQANHDFLTELNNRYYFYQSEKRIIKNNKTFALLLIDIDHFKEINDDYGNHVGDFLLKEVSKRLTLVKNEHDLLVRYSGDEFIYVVNTYDINDDVESKCQEIISILKRPYSWNEISVEMTASIGVSKYPEDGHGLDELKRNADLALFEAKKTNDTISFFHSKLKDEHLTKISIEKKLKKAIEKNELSLVFQPQVRKNETLYGFEALLRWNNKDLGSVSPLTFIPIAESCGIMPSIGHFVISEAIQKISALNSKFNKNYHISINVSVTQVLSSSFVESIEIALNNCKLSPSNIMIEITESIFINDSKTVTKVFNELRALGVRISLDDFGTGYSSLGYLKDLPIDELKVDKCFIDDIETDQNAFSMTKGILHLSKDLNLVTVAEGIENKAQFELLKNLDCDLFQGYYFSKPLLESEIDSFLMKRMK